MEDDHTFEEKIILQQLGRGTQPKRKRRRLLEGQELPKKRNQGLKKWKESQKYPKKQTKKAKSRLEMLKTVCTQPKKQAADWNMSQNEQRKIIFESGQILLRVGTAQ